MKKENQNLKRTCFQLTLNSEVKTNNSNKLKRFFQDLGLARAHEFESNSNFSNRFQFIPVPNFMESGMLQNHF